MQTTLVTAPATLNGYPVIKSEVHDNGYVTIMVAKPAGLGDGPGQKYSEFVVATWWPDLGTGWSWGHYFSTYGKTDDEARNKADADFNETAQRNKGR